MASIKGTMAAELPAPNKYWTMYLVQMTSAFLAGFTSGENQYNHQIHIILGGKGTSSIRIQRIKRPHQPNPSPKRSHNWQRQSTNSLLQTPSKQQQRNR
jgi:hypothetical protein